METKDGYIVRMNRIPQPLSFNVVYFQHGVIDNSATWVSLGPADSIAYQAQEAGFDVFLGNFRGNYPRKSAQWKDPDTYWDYTLDHIAKYDLQAFIQKIYKLKLQELKEVLRRKSEVSDEEQLIS